MKKQELQHARKKDIVILIVVVIASGIFSYFFRNMFLERFKIPFIFLWVVLLFEPVFVSYLESRDQDPFVTGKTERLGVVNSFTTAAVAIGIASKWFWGWLITSIVVAVCMFAARELGRKKRGRLEEKYLMKNGVLLTDLHNYGMASIDGKDAKVCSKKDLKKGTAITISEIKGTYLYVKENES